MSSDTPQSPRSVPRVDSFEVIDVDCTPLLTDEEKNWPVVALRPRVDSFEQIDHVPTSPPSDDKLETQEVLPKAKILVNGQWRETENVIVEEQSRKVLRFTLREKSKNPGDPEAVIQYALLDAGISTQVIANRAAITGVHAAGAFFGPFSGIIGTVVGSLFRWAATAAEGYYPLDVVPSRNPLLKGAVYENNRDQFRVG